MSGEIKNSNGFIKASHHVVAANLAETSSSIMEVWGKLVSYEQTGPRKGKVPVKAFGCVVALDIRLLTQTICICSLQFVSSVCLLHPNHLIKPLIE